MTHTLIPRSRPFTQKFFTLQYYDAATGNYARGWDDMYFVLFSTVIVTGVRVAVMDYVFQPLARACGLRRKRTVVRFAEQGWLAVYYGGFWALGMVRDAHSVKTGTTLLNRKQYIMSQHSYFFNVREVWTEFPRHKLDGLFKWYYLVQFGFWLQQIIVVNIEERRNDYAQMFTHHIFTSALVFFSYGYYQEKVGNVILCLMDLADILLPVSRASF